MASQASLVATVFKLADKTSGRDRICRLVQYGSKFVYWALEVEGLSPELVKKLKALESSISTARKLFRLGKSLDNFRGALQTIHLGDALLRFLVTMTKINRGIYLLFDHVLWAHRMKLVVIDSNFWVTYSNRFWLFAIFLSLIRDVYEILKQLKLERNRLKHYSGNGDKISSLSVLRSAFVNNPAVTIDLVKNSTDLFIPASRLELMYLPGGIVGLLGVVSSIAGLIVSYNENMKLKFS